MFGYDIPEKKQIRTCKTEGCDSPLDWRGPKGFRTGAWYCKRCSRKRSRESAREHGFWVRDSRIGQRSDHDVNNSPLCEVCLLRRARIGFTWCMKCSVCVVCGKNNPRSKYADCNPCSEKNRARGRTEESKSRRAAWRRKNSKRLAKWFRDKWKNDPEWRAKRLSENIRRIKKQRLDRKSDHPCLWCGKIIPKESNARQKYCSVRCNHAHLYRLRVPRPTDHICKVCGISIPTGKRTDVKYCSNTCILAQRRANAAQIRAKKKAVRNCAFCGESIPETRTLKAIYCGKRCQKRAYDKRNRVAVRRRQRVWREKNREHLRMYRMRKRMAGKSLT